MISILQLLLFCDYNVIIEYCPLTLWFPPISAATVVILQVSECSSPRHAADLH